MQLSGRTEFFWPRQLVRKWLQFKPTGDDFQTDFHHFEYDSPVGEDEEGKENNGESLEFPPEVIIPEHENWRMSSSPLMRAQSESLRNQYVEKKEYRIAVGTWNVAGQPPPVELDLDVWLDSRQDADIYVLGFQEIVPLNAGNVLCIEDEEPAAKWENLIREALNKKTSSMFQIQSRSAPQSPLRELGEAEVAESDIERIIEGVASDDQICSLVEFESLEPRRTCPNQCREGDLKPCSKQRFRQAPDEKSGRRISAVGRTVSDAGRLSTASESRQTLERGSQSAADRRLSVDPGLARHESLYDWSLKVATPGPAEGFHSFLEQEESLQTPLVGPSVESQSFSRDSSESGSRFSRIASKQMVGLFLTVWVRTDLREDVHNVKVSCVGCGLMGYLGNKGSVSVSMCLHQTSFCFTCAHLTSGNKEGDECRRNSDVGEILRRTAFPRSSKMLQLPESIMAHDCMIWFGDLNYRLTLPDHEARCLVAREDWDLLLENDQLRIEQNAGNVFDGWQEGPICFAPTYKYAPNSDRYSVENTKPGEKRRAPAWCDRILWRGQALREIQYDRTESRLSDHRPVSGVFLADLECFNRHKLKKALAYASPNPNIIAEDISPHLSSLRGFHRLPLNEMKYPALSEQRITPPVAAARLTVSQSFKIKLQKEQALSAGCMKVGEDMEKISKQVPLHHNVLSVF